ncbi:MAG: hypothetical protein ACQRW7_04885 [Caulobacterales bacterium]|uniref:hypothetical protein n=1 Tax=Glycocaulis sp. TaxID=1969725 RepID=UPI003F9FEDA4
MKKPITAGKREPSRVCLNIRDHSGARARERSSMQAKEKERDRLDGELRRLRIEMNAVLAQSSPAGVTRPLAGRLRPLAVIDAAVTVADTFSRTREISELDRRIQSTERSLDVVRREIANHWQEISRLVRLLDNQYREFGANGCEGSPMSWVRF